MSTATISAPRLRFGRFELQVPQRRLLADGAPVEIGARALDLLLVLVRRAGEMVSKNELLDLVWPDVIVEEANLHVQVSALRKLIGREAIATVPGRGYQFVVPIAADSPPALPAAPAAPSTAFAALPPLLGRDDDLAQVTQALARSGFVTITGAGGSGKTLLARHLAARAGAPSGAAPAWVDLVELTAPEDVVPAVGAAVRAHGPPRTAAALARALGDVHLLLVLDNAEHVLEAVRELVDALRQHAPGVTLLVTSQAPLRRPGEWVHALRGLSVPPSTGPAESALQHAAVALFVAQARQADRRFRFGDAEVDDVVAICASLAGSALGVQLAAALLGQMPLAAVRARLARRETGPDAAAVDPAANVLRSALSWSHDLLSPAARRVFRRLAIAQGPLPLALVQALAVDGEGPEATDEVDAALGDLVDRSLVHCEAAAQQGPHERPRYRLLEAPRALALEQLQAAGERALAQARMVQALVPLAERWRAGLRVSDSPAVADPGLAAELPVASDLIAAFESALQAPGVTGAADAIRLGDLILPLLTTTLAATRMRWAQVLGARVDEPGLPAALRGRALLQVSSMIRHSNLQAKQAVLTRAAAAWQEAGEVEGEYRALALLAETASTAGRQAEAEALLARVVAIEDPAWPPGWRRVRWYSEGIVAGAAGDLPRAIAAWREHLRLTQRMDGQDGELVRALYALAHDELVGGDAAAALPRLEEATARARRRRGDEALHAYLLPTLVAAQVALGRFDEARVPAAEGWPHARDRDADPWWADTLALMAAREGRPRTAARLLGLADAGYARLHQLREAMERRAAETAEALARSALGDRSFEALRAEGADASAERAVTAAALATEDSPPSLA